MHIGTCGFLYTGNEAALWYGFAVFISRFPFVCPLSFVLSGQTPDVDERHYQPRFII